MVHTIKSKISAETFRAIFDYDPNTGELTRTLYSKGRVGNIIISHDLELFGEKHETSRFIWLHYYGEWPPLDMLVDHIDRDRSNNKLNNLRLASSSQNNMNRNHSTNRFGCKGIEFKAQRRPWIARIYHRSERIYLGAFFTFEEARDAYLAASQKYHGEFACPIQ